MSIEHTTSIEISKTPKLLSRSIPSITGSSNYINLITTNQFTLNQESDIYSQPVFIVYINNKLTTTFPTHASSNFFKLKSKISSAPLLTRTENESISQVQEIQTLNKQHLTHHTDMEDIKLKTFKTKTTSDIEHSAYTDQSKITTENSVISTEKVFEKNSRISVTDKITESYFETDYDVDRSKKTNIMNQTASNGTKVGHNKIIRFETRANQLTPYFTSSNNEISSKNFQNIYTNAYSTLKADTANDHFDLATTRENKILNPESINEATISTDKTKIHTTDNSESIMKEDSALDIQSISVETTTIETPVRIY
ncbi:hypothetical protein RF11_05890 [Thelohanellus kitauei]|uniref:Uncharacterized protein n=1 Tax=Thelohanellus kitauei TaxID=669202 RepID=A0A0C2MRN4_THEKT|nr:hypothetical protein RF11_05890 [Thelohanellus kitauei]